MNWSFTVGDKGSTGTFLRFSISLAKKWLALAGTSLDGVVAKRLDLPYQSGTRKNMLKIKRLRTVDCVVGGIIYGGSKSAVSHILVGLYEGELLHIGSAPLRATEGKKLAAINFGVRQHQVGRCCARASQRS